VSTATIAAMVYGFFFGITTVRYGGKHFILMLLMGIGFYLLGMWVGYSV